MTVTDTFAVVIVIVVAVLLYCVLWTGAFGWFEATVPPYGGHSVCSSGSSLVALVASALCML